MTGLNRVLLKEESISYRKNVRNIKCVFISHQKKDAEFCKQIAEYIMNSGVDVYFDEYDSSLNRHMINNDLKGVVSDIQKGIDNSTHMLCVISYNTKDSKWVPWEVGYGYDKIQNLTVLTLKGIDDDELPEYLRVVDIIRGTKSLNSYLSDLVGEPEDRMFSDRRLINESRHNHPLNNCLDFYL